jgi:type I site-specific restriction endonuclease
MPAPSLDFKKAIKQLTDKEKESLLLRAVRRDAEWYETLAYELLEDVTLEQLIEETSEKIHDLLHTTSGRSFARSLTKSLRKSLHEIARFKRITKDAKGEIDLHLYLLKLIFDNFTGQFESLYRSFYVATARLTVRTAQLIRKNLHEDYHLEYKALLDDYFAQLHSRTKSSGLSFALPREFTLE